MLLTLLVINQADYLSNNFSQVHICFRGDGYAQATQNSYFGSYAGDNFVFDDVRCDSGPYTNIFQCSHAGIGNHNCQSREKAGVICSGKKSQEYYTVKLLV